MKKIVAFVISLVLFLCGVVFQNENVSRNVIIEQGSGKSERVTTVETLAEVLDSLTSRFSGTVYTSASGESRIEGVSENVSVSEEGQRAKYTDAMLTFETNGMIGADINNGSDYGSVSVSTKMTFDRSMTCLFTEDAAYYHIDAEIRQSGSSSEGKSKSFISMEVELYVIENTTLMRISEMTVLANGANSPDLKEMLGKWIDCGKNGGGMFESINAQNYAQLAIIGDCIDEHEGDGFRKNGSTYTLKDEPCKELCMKLFALAGAGALPESCLKTSKFAVDLSNATTPVMDLSYTIKYKEGSSQCSGMENTRITVTDINRGNTVRIPNSAEIYDISDFSDLM